MSEKEQVQIKNKHQNFFIGPNVVCDLGLTVYELALLVFYIRVGNCFMNSSTICKKLKISKPTLSRTRKSLEDRGFLHVKERPRQNPKVHGGFSVVVDMDMLWEMNHNTNSTDVVNDSATVVNDSATVVNDSATVVNNATSKNTTLRKTKEEERDTAHATIDDLAPVHFQAIHPPLSSLESFILGEIESALKTHGLSKWVFKKVNGSQPNESKFKEFCSLVNRKTFKSDLESLLRAWESTGFGSRGDAPTIGRIISAWGDSSAKADREYTELIKPLQEAIRRGGDEARNLVNTEAYKTVKKKIKFNSLSFRFVMGMTSEQWSKLK